MELLYVESIIMQPKIIINTNCYCLKAANREAKKRVVKELNGGSFSSTDVVYCTIHS